MSVLANPDTKADEAVEKTIRRIDDPQVSGADRRRLVQLAFRFVWNRDDAEDAVQDALTIVHEKQTSPDDESKRQSWLARIVVRRSLLLHRSVTRRLARERKAACSEPSSTSSGSDRSETLERVQLTRWAIAQLPPQQRTAVTLRHLQGMSYDELAEIMEVSPSTARGHVRSARETMRRAIVVRHPEFGSS